MCVLKNIKIIDPFQHGIAKSNSSGNLTVTMTKKQKACKVLSVTATDKAGNTSSVKTAPSIPSVNTVTTKTTKVTGKAEATPLYT